MIEKPPQHGGYLIVDGRKRRGSPRERFLANYTVDETSGCWNWTPLINRPPDRYGTIKVNGKIIQANRLSYMLHRGKIPHGFLVLHKCDNPKCVNPDHLFLGTQRDNVHDCMKKCRRVVKLGSSHQNSKITENDVKYIRDMCAKGVRGTAKSLALAFQIAQTTISQIVTKKTWKHAQ